MTSSGNLTANETVEAISTYIDSISTGGTINANKTLDISKIDEIMASLNGSSDIKKSSTSSFVMVLQINPSASEIVLGAAVGDDGDQIVDNSTVGSILNPGVSAAAVIDPLSASGLTSLSILIMKSPTAFETIDTVTNAKLASPLIVVARNPSNSPNFKIDLHFTPLSSMSSGNYDEYNCAFYNVNAFKWDRTGCSNTVYNSTENRYSCNCNHTTSFGLIWLPSEGLQSVGRRDLRPVDIASLVFQSLSIVCFIIIIIHSLATRLLSPIKSLQSSDLLPLISCASTTLLFIFYIALALTVYTRTSSANETECFLSSKVLMFFVYFLLIFMFCTKTTIGYFNYLRFVYLFPQPSFRRLYILLFISFLISIGWVSFAAGFDSNSSYEVTHLYPYVLCWFPKNAIYYFLTIPVCIFLLLNFITIFFVSKQIISHARRATSPHQSYERMKRCVLVLLSSCVTQGVGWLFGPFISFADPTAGSVLEWFFVVFNGLEGVWSILLYIIIRAQRLDEHKRVTAVEELTKSSSLRESKYRKSTDRQRRDSGRTGDIEIVQRSIRRDLEREFNDLNEDDTTSL